MQNSEVGELACFDGQISTGSLKLDKKDCFCYIRIAEIINEERKSILLISSSMSEIKAATLAGFKVCLLNRENGSILEDLNYKIIDIARNLNEIEFK